MKKNSVNSKNIQVGTSLNIDLSIMRRIQIPYPSNIVQTSRDIATSDGKSLAFPSSRKKIIQDNLIYEIINNSIIKKKILRSETPTVAKFEQIKRNSLKNSLIIRWFKSTDNCLLQSPIRLMPSETGQRTDYFQVFHQFVKF